MKRVFAVLAVVWCASTMAVRSQEKERMGQPEVHGTIRSKYEFQPGMGAGRFNVRNARISVVGDLLPMVSYKAEIDLCDEGRIKMLDAYACIGPWKNLTVTAGQMRVPFTIDAHRSPHQQYFANRSFIAKWVGNVRDVGVTLGYTLPTDWLVVLEGGLYNGSGLTNQQVWHRDVNYSAKLQLFPLDGFNVSFSTQAIQPETVWMYAYDVGMYYEFYRFHVEGEYLLKTYSGQAFSPVHAVNVFVNCDFPLRRVFTKLSLLMRYDMMTDWSNAVDTDEKGKLVLTDGARQRLTGGVTLSLDRAFRADLRLNYEMYFYPSDGVFRESEQDKLLLELMVRF